MTQWYTPFITIDIPLLEKVLRTVVVYLAIAILLRIAGKRLLAQMNSLDLVVLLLLSNVVQNAIIGPDNSVLGALVGAVVLIGFDLAMDLLADRFAGFRHLIAGRHADLVAHGVADDRALARAGIDSRELALALRRQGIHGVSQVESATLEPAGDLLIDLKAEERTVTKRDLDAAVAELRALLRAEPGRAASGT